jgi:hypothetical protein
VPRARVDLWTRPSTCRAASEATRAQQTRIFTRALTAWDQPELGWAHYTLHVADVTGDGMSDLVWNERLTTRNRTYTAISVF